MSKNKFVFLLFFIWINTVCYGVLADDVNTKGLWHMDTLQAGMVPDDDAADAGRDKNLSLGYSGIPAPVLTSGSGGYFNEALQFDGNNIARSASFWSADIVNVTIECRLFIEEMPTADAIVKYLISCPNNYSLYLSSDGKMYWETKDPATAGRVSMTVSDKLNQWLHVIAVYDDAGRQLSLRINDTVVSSANWRPMISVPSSLEIGHYIGKPATRGFRGKLDELKISGTPPANPRITVTDNGSSVTLSNGIVTGVIQKSNATMTELYKGSSPNLIGSSWYWDCNGNGGLYSGASNAVYSLVSSSDEQAEISCKSTGLLGGVLDMEVHYILRRADSGFYAFVIYSTPGAASAWSFEQARCVVRNSPNVFYYMALDEIRQKTPPTPQELAAAQAAGGTLNPPEATLMPDGSVDDKYLYGEYVRNFTVYGWGGYGYGMWMITPSTEFFNSSPIKQELTIHQTTTTPVMMSVFHGGHFLSGLVGFEAGETWKKVCGPVFLYVNEKPDVAQQWVDAKVRAKAERDHWPYAWMNHLDYPLVRGTVRGTLEITDGTSPEKAWVILAEPETPPTISNWQSQYKGYQFYAQTDSSGHFEIKNVRPGSYTLYTYTAGVPEEYRRDGIAVTAGQITDVGTIAWQPFKYGRKVWQIGVFDRTAGEYKYGDLFHDGHSWGMWYNYPTDFPNDIIYTIGQSNERTDWNYTQISYLKLDGTYHTPIWKVLFNLDTPAFGQAMLTVGIAAQRVGALEVTVNGTRVEYDTGLDSGSACVRNSIQGTYELKRIVFNSSLLRLGSNTIAFREFRGGNFVDIQYDAIRLEIPLAADLNHDGYVALLDLNEFGLQWLTPGTTADLNNDKIVNGKDFLLLAKDWLK